MLKKDDDLNILKSYVCRTLKSKENKITIMSLSVYPIKSEVKIEEFDLFKSLISSLERTKTTLENGDIIIISSKFVANSQGRVIDYEHVIPSEESKSLGKKFQINP